MATKQKITIIGKEARDRAKEGTDLLADAVKTTHGPYGLHALLEKGNKLTKDGITVGQEIEHDNVFAQRALTLLREAMIKVVHLVGDGSTSAVIMAQAIFGEVVRLLPKDTQVRGSKKTPAEIRSLIAKECKEVIEKLKAMATPITTEDQLISSAMVSSEDEELSNLIGKTQFELGPAGVILVEETILPTCSVEVLSGIRTDGGLAVPGMFNNQEKQSIEFPDGCKVFITNHIFNDLRKILDTLNAIDRQGVKDVILIGRGFSPEAIKQIAANMKGGFNIIPVNGPYTDQDEILRDMTAILGGRFIDSEQIDQEDIQPSDIGYASRFVGRRYDSVFAGDEKDENVKKRVAKRITELQDRLKGVASDFEKRNLESRIAQLVKGFGLLYIGANSEALRKPKKDKADDAVAAVRAAFQEGVVPGAGLAFKEIADDLPDDYILKQPLYALYNHLKDSAPSDFVVPEWVKDPLKVMRIVLQESCEVASTLATIGVINATKKDSPRYVQEATPENEVVN